MGFQTAMNQRSASTGVMLGYLVLLGYALLFFSASWHEGVFLRAVAWTAPGASTVMILPAASLVPGTEVWETFYETSAKEGEVLLTLPVESYHLFLVDAKTTSMASSYPSSSPSSSPPPSLTPPTPYPPPPNATPSENTKVDASSHERPQSSRTDEFVSHETPHPTTPPRPHHGHFLQESEEELSRFRHRLSTLSIRADYVARAAVATAAGHSSSPTIRGVGTDSAQWYQPLPVPTFLCHPFSFVTNLSDTWEVIADGASPSSQRLLHCRIPYAKSPAAVLEEEAKLIAAHEEEMSQALQEWWETFVLPKGGEGLHGNGDIFLDGPWSWYLLCPSDGFYRVHSELLRLALTPTPMDRDISSTATTAITSSSGISEGEEEEEKERRELLQKKREYLERWRTCNAISPYHSDSVSEASEETTHLLAAPEEDTPHARRYFGALPPVTSFEEEGKQVTPPPIRREKKKQNGKSNKTENREGILGKLLARRVLRRHPPTEASTLPTAKTPLTHAEREKQRKQKQKEMDALVHSFQREKLRCGPSFYHLLESDVNPLLKAAITKVGEYRPHSHREETHTPARNSRPRWNADLRAFEMWYPSSTPCMQERTLATVSTPSSTSSVSQDDAAIQYWSTRFVFRCRRGRGSTFPNDEDAPHPGAPPHHRTPGGPSRTAFDMGGRHGNDGVDEDAGKGKSGKGSPWSMSWSIAELRQKCVIEVEMASSELVCLWNSFLDQSRLNPIPCVDLD